MKAKHGNASKRILVMGVSGSGKSTIAQFLAKRNGYEMLDADTLHPPKNIEKMRAGHPLNDEDRAPWLSLVASKYSQAREQNCSLIIACSALKASYRKRLRAGDEKLYTVYLDVDSDALTKRMKNRKHFMPLALLQSQLDTLEKPHDEQLTISVDAKNTPSNILAEINQWLASYD